MRMMAIILRFSCIPLTLSLFHSLCRADYHYIRFSQDNGKFYKDLHFYMFDICVQFLNMTWRRQTYCWNIVEHCFFFSFSYITLFSKCIIIIIYLGVSKVFSFFYRALPPKLISRAHLMTINDSTILLIILLYINLY